MASMNAAVRTLPARDRFVRLFLVVNSVLLICLTLTGYFLLDCGFFTEKGQPLYTIAEHNLVARESKAAAQYFFDVATQGGKDDINNARDHFSEHNSNFFFAVLSPAEPDAPADGEAADTNGEEEKPSGTQPADTVVFSNFSADPAEDAVPPGRSLENGDEKLMLVDLLTESPPESFRNLYIRRYLRDPLTAHDEFYRAQKLDRRLQMSVYPVLVLFALSALAEGYLLTRLCARADAQLDPPSLQDLHRVPLYILLIFYALLTAIGLYLLYGHIIALYQWAIFADSTDIRPTVYVILLLLAALTWLASLLISTVRARLAVPQWWRQTLIYRTINQPSVEQRLQAWIGAAVTLEFTVFLVVFQIFHVEDSRLFLAIDILFTLMILLITSVRSKSTAVYMQAAHRIAQEKQDTIPTKGLRGQSLRHVQNINFLSRSAGEQMQRRFVNESFSTKLINSVSHGLRDPLTAVTRTVEQLRSGTLNEAQTQQKIAEVNLYSQELKKTIEDLLRIADASAGNTKADLTPTDVGMMLEQTVGEFFDRFRQKGLDLVEEAPETSLCIPADGSCMWTVFESVLNEYLLLAVRGTRVFLRAAQTNGKATLHFQGTVRTDKNAITQAQMHYGSLDLPTAKVFTELQNGAFRYQYAQDILTVDLQFPLCSP